MDMAELGTWLAGGLLTLTGAGLILWQALSMQRAAASRQWPRAHGEVLRSFVDEQEDSDAPYLVKVICRYRVDGTEYTCNRLRFGLALWSSIPMTWFSRALKKYHVGDSVEVAYNPKRPEESVLEPGFAVTMLSGLGFGFLFLVLGILTLR